MKKWKKYLAAAAVPAVILIMVLILQNKGGKNEAEFKQNRSAVNESIRAEDTGKKEENSLLASGTESAEESQNISEKNVKENTKSKSEKEIKSEIDKLINTYYLSESDTADNKENNKKVQTADDSKEKEDNETSEIIEEYRNIKNYVKPGLDEDSYIVFSTYKIKLFNIKTLVPGMSSLIIEKDEEGNLAVHNDSDNKELNNYIKKLAGEKDIKKIMNEVNSELSEAVKKDTSLKAFIDYIK